MADIKQIKTPDGTAYDIIDAGLRSTIKAAAEKAVDTSVAAGSSSTNLPTSAAVATLVSNQKPFHKWVSANSNTYYVITDSKITANHRVITETLVHSTANITWTTYDGSCRLECTAGIPAMGLCFYLP